MELSKQIKKHRHDANLSQDELADKIFVSRQTISNWENDKSYPDVKSLLLLSEVFQISLDNLIKGDLEKMKREINVQEYAKFQKDSIVFAILFLAILILPAPLFIFLRWYGIAVYLLVFSVGMYYALRIEKYKKKYNVQTYKEIIAFTEGQSLNDIEKAREEGKRPYQKILLMIGFALLAFIVTLAIAAIIKNFII